MNVYKDLVILHNITLDPRDAKLFVDWLLSCEQDSQAYKIGEAMQAAIDNYVAGTILNNICATTGHTMVINMNGGNEND